MGTFIYIITCVLVLILTPLAIHRACNENRALGIGAGIAFVLGLIYWFATGNGGMDGATRAQRSALRSATVTSFLQSCRHPPRLPQCDAVGALGLEAAEVLSSTAIRDLPNLRSPFASSYELVQLFG
jgi:hypothetical protein